VEGGVGSVFVTGLVGVGNLPSVSSDMIDLVYRK
jgi:hypothetical protein